MNQIFLCHATVTAKAESSTHMPPFSSWTFFSLSCTPSCLATLVYHVMNLNNSNKNKLLSHQDQTISHWKQIDLCSSLFRGYLIWSLNPSIASQKFSAKFFLSDHFVFLLGQFGIFNWASWSWISMITNIIYQYMKHIASSYKLQRTIPYIIWNNTRHLVVLSHVSKSARQSSGLSYFLPRISTKLKQDNKIASNQAEYYFQHKWQKPTFSLNITDIFWFGSSSNFPL